MLQVVRIFGRIVELLHRDRHGCFSAVVLEITEGVARTAKLDHVGNIVLRVPHNGSSARINIEESDRFFGILEILQIFHNTCLICKEVGCLLLFVQHGTVEFDPVLPRGWDS